MSDDNITALAALMGRLEKTVETSFREVRTEIGTLGKRMTVLEEFKIRAEEREQTRNQIRAEFERQEERRRERAAEEDQARTNRVSVSLYRWQLWAAVAAIVVAVAIAYLTQVH